MLCWFLLAGLEVNAPKRMVFFVTWTVNLVPCDANGDFLWFPIPVLSPMGSAGRYVVGHANGTNSVNSVRVQRDRPKAWQQFCSILRLSMPISIFRNRSPPAPSRAFSPTGIHGPHNLKDPSYHTWRLKTFAIADATPTVVVMQKIPIANCEIRFFFIEIQKPRPDFDSWCFC